LHVNLKMNDWVTIQDVSPFCVNRDGGRTLRITKSAR
jgi:hypothetical protein